MSDNQNEVGMSEADMDTANDQISAIFEGRSLEDVASVLKVQLAMLVTQGAEDADEAVDFLEEIRESVEEMVRSYDFSEDDA